MSSVSERTRRAGRPEVRSRTAAAVARASACTSGAIMLVSTSAFSRGERSTPRSARCMTACTSCSGRVSSRTFSSAVHLARSDSRLPEGTSRRSTANCLSMPSGRLLIRSSASSARRSARAAAAAAAITSGRAASCPLARPFGGGRARSSTFDEQPGPASAPAGGSAEPAR